MRYLNDVFSFRTMDFDRKVLFMQTSQVYHEKLTSIKTTALFLILTILFFCLFSWRLLTVGMDWLAILLLVLACFFLFYTINYRTLDIQISFDNLKLQFGVFSWQIPLNSIAHFQLDNDIPWLMRNGGAGIHFMFVRGRYRASFNFLEHPRVVLRFKHKIGPVTDLSFSTAQPSQLIKHLEEAISIDGVTDITR